MNSALEYGRMQSSRTIALIPARAGSKGLPGKNTRQFFGRALYKHSIEAARQAGIKDIFVSTDIPEILADTELDAEVVERPSILAADHTPMAQVVRDFVHEHLQGEATIVLLQPTSPLRTKVHIQEAMSLYAKGKHPLVLSVTAVSNASLKYGFVDEGYFNPVSKPEYCFSNRQLLPSLHRPNGAVYVFDSRVFRYGDEFPTEKIGAVMMDSEDSRDIDTLEDFLVCESLFAKRVEKNV